MKRKKGIWRTIRGRAVWMSYFWPIKSAESLRLIRFAYYWTGVFTAFVGVVSCIFLNNILLPNILWLLSGLFFIRSIWLLHKNLMERNILIFFIIAILVELLQILPFLPYAFNIFDLLYLCSTAFVESVIFYCLVFRRIK